MSAGLSATGKTAPGLIVAAPASGSGKTVFTLGLIRHFARRGEAIASAKVGPDYIDPAFHEAASGRACLNLDPWGMRRATFAAAVRTLSGGADLIVCEGVMGLFDGATARQGSTADVAALSGWPVVLVVDASAQAASAAAVVRGFATLRADVTVAAVVFNRTGGPRHDQVLREACAAWVPEVPVLGAIPRTEGLQLPERHLGLVQAREHGDLARFIDRAADLVAAHVDTATLRILARPWPGDWDSASQFSQSSQIAPLPPLGQRIAVADDAAFAFRYPLLLDGWHQAGAEISLFSPLADEAPPADATAIYLPGGYPELHAGRLAGSGRFQDGLRGAQARGAVIFGECGGYMVLGEALVDAEGTRHAMTAMLPLETSFAARGLHLGYRQATLCCDSPLGRVGTRFRGHEFHYARTLREGPGKPLFTCEDARGTALGTTGLIDGRVMGSFIHLIDRAEG